MVVEGQVVYTDSSARFTKGINWFIKHCKPSPPPLTVNPVFKEFMESRSGREARTTKDYRCLLGRFVRSEYGQKHVDEIGAERIKEFLDSLTPVGADHQE